MTTEPAAPHGDGRATRVLQVAREGFANRGFSGEVLRALGFPFAGEFAVLGDGTHAVLIEAARTGPGFGSLPVDKDIAVFLDGSFGVGRWQRDRPPHRWEKGGGDAKLDQLYDDEAAARVEFEKCGAAMWRARDAVSAARQQEGGSSIEGVAVATKQLQDAITAWQESKQRLETRIARRLTRQIDLQEKFRRQAAQGT